ncbi:nucleoside hydrolase [Komagataeibacter diospyri]|uniref:Inosine-uridine preferring nucleoside hydrolase n=1 Tax=Komagataeibacter diospyri TaxID=1932662 RepID=A0A4P5NQE3_9PROT|nr:nucleoside hydrolase [Komagataeibacter diospyri]GCE82667.1 inosine-uridine preferring nucleoside hydrolase [Komagataeibacter diospyri]
MDVQKIIIDTDPGQDDAIAIMMALASPDLKVLGLSTVAGNVPVSQTATNACKILELAERPDIPVHAGCATPLRRTPITAEHVHGRTGMDGPDLPQPTRPPQAGHAVDFLIDTIRAHPAGSITVVTLGPMTNLAVALIKAPDIAPRIRQVVSMGGAYSECGNITPNAEFNIFADPDAADIVLRRQIPLTLVPLDITHQFLISPSRLASLRALPGRCAQAAVSMLGFSERFDLEKYGWDGAPLHDPCTIGWLLAPDLFAGRMVNVSVEVDSPLMQGATAVDWWQVTDRPHNALFLREVDSAALWKVVLARLSRLP